MNNKSNISIVNPKRFCIFNEQNRNGLASKTVSNIHINSAYMNTSTKVQNFICISINRLCFCVSGFFNLKKFSYGL